MPSHPVSRLFLCPKTVTFRYIKVGHCGSLDIRPCGLRHGVSVGGTLCLRLFFVQMDVQVMTWLQNEATTLFADRKSLPKRRKTREKGRDSQSRRPEISTQKAENGRKGRDSQFTRPEISTQKAENPEIGREPPVRAVLHPTTGSAVSHPSSPSFASPQISTQKAENPICPNIKNYAN